MPLTEYQRCVYNTLAFEGAAPDANALGQTWRTMLREANNIIAMLPEDQIGNCIITQKGSLFTGTPDELKTGLQDNFIHFHPGCIRGAWPVIGRKIP